MHSFQLLYNLPVNTSHRLQPVNQTDLQEGMALTSAVTTELIPILARDPRITPQDNARY